MHRSIAEHRDAIAELCRRHAVRSLDVFGSAARGDDFDPSRSDVDLLVEFGPEAPRTMAALLDFEDAAARVFARPVDVLERQALDEAQNPHRKRRILSEAQPLYPP